VQFRRKNPFEGKKIRDVFERGAWNRERKIIMASARGGIKNFFHLKQTFFGRGVATLATPNLICWALMFKNLHDQTHQSIQSLAGLVSSTQPTDIHQWDIDTHQLDPFMKQIPPLIGQISQLCPAEHLALYCFEIISPDAGSEEILDVYAQAKADKGRSFARMNKASQTLYVGSSRSFSKRIREHLGFGFPRTYAIHLAYWAPKLGLQLRLHAALYPVDSAPKAVQALEDCLWESLKPMLGRQGQR